MNQVVDDNVQTTKCNQMSTNMKNKSKKAKDPSKTDELYISKQEKLSDTLANTLHINSLNSNLTNGTSDHSNGDVDLKSNRSETPDKSKTEIVYDVNSVQCSDTAINHEHKETSTFPMDRCILDNALGNLEKSLIIRPESPQDDINIISYDSELQMPEIMRLIQKDLSEPYSIYTYRYFIHNWPKLCFLATHEGKCIGAIVCKLDLHRNVVKRGYIAMLAVDEKYRKRKIGSRLVRRAIQVIH